MKTKLKMLMLSALLPCLLMAQNTTHLQVRFSSNSVIPTPVYSGDSILLTFIMQPAL